MFFFSSRASTSFARELHVVNTCGKKENEINEEPALPGITLINRPRLNVSLICVIYFTCQSGKETIKCPGV